MKQRKLASIWISAGLGCCFAGCEASRETSASRPSAVTGATPAAAREGALPGFRFAAHQARKANGDPVIMENGKPLTTDAKSPPREGYTRGMAESYRRMRARLNLPRDNRDAWVAAVVAPASGGNDVLVRYRDVFQRLGLNVVSDEEDRLRAIYVTLYKLGVRESDGRYYLGVDDGPHKAAEAKRRLESGDRRFAEQIGNETEAGAFQSSWDFVSGNRLAVRLYEAFRSGERRDDLLEIFRVGYGDGPPGENPDLGIGGGAEFQRVAKTKPNFAVECAALTLRRPGVMNYHYTHFAMMDFQRQVLEWLRRLER